MKDRIGTCAPESHQSMYYKERARDFLVMKEKKKGVSNLTPLLLNIGYDNYKEHI